MLRRAAKLPNDASQCRGGGSPWAVLTTGDAGVSKGNWRSGGQLVRSSGV